MDSLLLLPGQPGFNEILATPPPDPTKSKNFVVRKGGWVAESVDEQALQDYFDSGEYDERLDEIEQQNTVEINQELRSNILYLPCTMTI